MKTRSALGAFQVIAIGVVSAAAVFALHRSYISDPATSLTSSRPALPLEPSSTQTDVETGVQHGASAEPAARSEPELLAKAGPGGDENENEVEAAAAEPTPERRGRDVPNPHVEALRNPSPVYRNVSLTTVIREAGYVCTDILSSAAGDDGLATWRVSCEDARAYLVSEDDAGGLRVEPIAYIEVPVRPRMQMIPEPPNAPRTPVPPQSR